jgi:transporter family protein
MREWLPWTFAALFFWGVWGLLPKLASQYLPPKSVLVYELIGVFTVGFIVLASIKFQPDFHLKGFIFAILAGAAGITGGYMYVNAVSRGPVGIISVISALYPAIVVLAAYFILGETFNVRQTCGLVLAFIAIVLLAA